jgi:hypothetical protein
MSASDLKLKIDAVEEAYEYMLGYAAQGVEGAADHSRTPIREHLEKCDSALSGLASEFRDVVANEGLTPQEPFDDFLEVLERDAKDARAAVGLVLAQPSIGSQIVDNLNASIHLRALLTDLFLVDEILKKRLRPKSKAAGSNPSSD